MTNTIWNKLDSSSSDLAYINHRLVITGGPGSGKTTLIKHLSALGYDTFGEIARDLIENGSTPPLWGVQPSPNIFFQSVLKSRIHDYLQLPGGHIGFYDRGIPDCLAFFAYQNRKVPAVLEKAIRCYRYNQRVFIAPPWEEIYTFDSVRKESFSAAEQLFELLTDAYRSQGYQLIELPKASVEVRVNFILSEINALFTEPQSGR